MINKPENDKISKKGWTEPYTAIELSVKQSFTEPPLLVATHNGAKASRVILDPNPQLGGVDLGEASLYRWRGKTGHEYVGILYRSHNYVPGQRYPLVLQNHGFDEAFFRASGGPPTAFAARELASEGILVLQIRDCPYTGDAEEGPCNVKGYEAAVEQLANEGLVDPSRVGIIGFSRTGFYVMETLTTGSLHIKAASITDSTLVDYLRYVLFTDHFAQESDSIIGAPPFGEGLQLWVKRSPGFNLDKITAPLLVVGEGPASLLAMWEPYAALRYLHKPVELVMLNTDEHVLTIPIRRPAWRRKGGQ
jgi:dipeptidyl aminopeptidase/acylaminoacyl peptidase